MARAETTIWYICPDATQPTGGVGVIYRHVDHLNDAGIRAMVVHDRPGFRYPWAASVKTPTTSRSEVSPIPSTDVIVWPEVYGPAIGTWALNCRQVILNQNAFNTFIGYDFFQPQGLPYLHHRTIAVIAVSHHSRRWLEYAFPGLKVHHIPPAIDERIFTYSAVKDSRICFMPRRGAETANQVLHILRQRGVLDTVDIVPIDRQPPSEVARIMQRSLVFLALSSQEGFGLPAAEAMACGCIVVGYDAAGGAEFMRPGLADVVPPGDVISFAAQVEEVLAQWRAEPHRLLAMGRRASRFVRRRYSLDREREDVLRFWKGILGSTSH
jgi:glycosyltransferase involved in cell wall biosynthesis